MNSGIYQIRNIIDNKRYIGSTKNFTKRFNRHKRDMIKGHWNIKLRRAIEKHNIDNFTFEIIEYVEYCKENILEKENFYISLYDSKRNGYNIGDASFGDNLSNHPDKIAIKLKISQSLIKLNESLSSDERKAKYGNSGKRNGMFGKSHNAETKRLISDKNKGKSFNKGIPKSGDHRNKISQYAKTRIGEKNAFFGKSHSDEAKRLISNKNKGRIPKNKKKISIDGVIYEDARKASELLFLKYSTIRYRIKSNNPKFKEYNDI